MPEGPEAAWISIDLNNMISGMMLTKIEYDESSRYSNIGIPEIELLPYPLKIYNVSSYGKKVIISMVGTKKYHHCCNNIDSNQSFEELQLSEQVKLRSTPDMYISDRGDVTHSTKKSHTKSPCLLETSSLQQNLPNRNTDNIQINDQKWYYLVFSLGMEGRFVTQPTQHSNLWLNFYNSKEKHKIMKIYFDDSRHFGSMKILIGKSNIKQYIRGPNPDNTGHSPPKTNQIGPCLLYDSISFNLWNSRFRINRLKNKKITIALMDQSIFAGIGNYLMSEILGYSKLSPFRNIESLTEEEMKELYNTAITIIRKSYSLGGCTVRSYIRPNGDIGGYIPAFYGCNKDPWGNKIESYNYTKGRKVWYSPSIQK